MILATTVVEDVDRFLDVFGTKGADKRAQHGSKGSTVFADPNEPCSRRPATWANRRPGGCSAPTRRRNEARS